MGSRIFNSNLHSKLSRAQLKIFYLYRQGDIAYAFWNWNFSNTIFGCSQFVEKLGKNFELEIHFLFVLVNKEKLNRLIQQSILEDGLFEFIVPCLLIE